MAKPKPAPQGESQTALDALPPEERFENRQGERRRARAWCVARIVDYRLQLLTKTDPDDPDSAVEFADVSGDAVIECDRETIYQLARANDGLLMSCNGLPGGGRMAQFQEAARAAVAAVTPARPERQEKRELPRATGDSSRSYTPQVPAGSVGQVADDDIPF